MTTWESKTRKDQQNLGHKQLMAEKVCKQIFCYLTSNLISAAYKRLGESKPSQKPDECFSQTFQLKLIEAFYL